MFIYELTYQIRVLNFEKGLQWYQKWLRREPDFIPHEGFAEWELIPGSWLQVAEGQPTEGSGPIRLGVKNIEAERDRLLTELNVESFEIYSREEVPVSWATFSDPWGNRLGMFEYLVEEEQQKQIHRILGKKL